MSTMPTSPSLQPGGMALPYPERWQAALRYVELGQQDGASSAGSSMAQDAQLMLYALKQQIVEGPCPDKSSSWGWNVVENAKIAAWKQLGSMNALEAMRLYVRTVEEEHPNWYDALRVLEGMGSEQQQQQPTQNGTATAAADADGTAGQTEAVGTHAAAGVWSVVSTQSRGKGPCPRYEHGSAILGGAMFVVGGNYAGRYLADVWRLDLNTSTWSQITLGGGKAATTGTTTTEANATGTGGQEPEQEPLLGETLPPIAGHTVTQWGDKLLVLGGHAKAKTVAAAGAMAVRVLDPQSGAVQSLETQGTKPCARGSHTTSRIGNTVWVFGGEDAVRKPLDDVHCLDLDTLTWSQPSVKLSEITVKKKTVKAGPGPRSAHSAAVYQDRYIVVFGGGSTAACYSDLWVLDTQAEGGPAWLTVKQQGHKVSPRAGHSAVVLQDTMYVVGGGNNVKGCTEVLGLDASTLAQGSVTWHSLSTTPPRDPLSSEGISLLVVPHPSSSKFSAVLLAFGGYNGKYHNTVSIMGPALLPVTLETSTSAQSLPSTRSVSLPGAVSANGEAQAAPSEVDVLRQEVEELKGQLAAARQEAEAEVKAAAASAANDAHELALLRKQLATTQAALETATKGLEDARTALGRESAKVMRLEVEGAELLKKLSAAAEERKELEALRRQIEEAESKKGSGIWGYITGSSE